jgi:TonB family protein
MCSIARRAASLLFLAVFHLVNPSVAKSQSPELILDRVDEGKLNLLASQTAQKIREAPVEEAQPPILVIDFFRNSPGTSSRLGSLLADRFSESMSAYSSGLKIIDRKVLEDYLTKEWTTLEDLESNEACLQIGRQLGATGIILGTLAQDKDSINLTLKIEGLGPKARIEDAFPWRARTASFLLNEDLRRMLFEPGPNYARKPDEIPEEPGVVRAGLQGVTSPVCIYCPQPDYSDAARVGKFQGTVRLSIVVTAEGQAKAIYVLKGAPFGLTEQTIKATREWHFKPAQKDGMPISSRVEMETTFHLY